MSSRYGVGPYGINAYSAPTTLVGEGTVVGDYTVTNARGSVAVAGVASMLASYLLFAEAKLLAGTSATVVGEFSLYAEPRYASQVYGQATIEAAFGVSALGSVEIMREGAAISATYIIVPDEQAQKFWKPNAPLGEMWLTVQQESSIWTKIPDSGNVWRQ